MQIKEGCGFKEKAGRGAVPFPQSTPLREGRRRGLSLSGSATSFNPRPCVRGDNYYLIDGLRDRLFQSTPLCEGRRRQGAARCTRPGFNPRPCVRGDAATIATYELERQFQSTPLCEGRQLVKEIGLPVGMFQSTPLCEGRHHVLAPASLRCQVSIHAPV